MAKLELESYVLELTLSKLLERGYQYYLSLTCDDIQVLAPWVEGVGDKPVGHLFIPADEAFDEAMRPLLFEEWPVKWTDDEDGRWCTAIGYPSAFRYAVELRQPNGYHEEHWEELGNAAKDKGQDRRIHDHGPKRFDLERDPDDPRCRLAFAFSSLSLGLRRGVPFASSSSGELCFSAYVSYDDLERFLDALKSEREAMMGGREKA